MMIVLKNGFLSATTVQVSNDRGKYSAIRTRATKKVCSCFIGINLFIYLLCLKLCKICDILRIILVQQPAKIYVANSRSPRPGPQLESPGADQTSMQNAGPVLSVLSVFHKNKGWKADFCCPICQLKVENPLPCLDRWYSKSECSCSACGFPTSHWLARLICNGFSKQRYKKQQLLLTSPWLMLQQYISICIISCIYNKWIQMKPSHGFNPLLGIIEPWLNHRIQRLGGSPRSARATLTEALTDSYHGNNSTSSLKHIQTTYCSLIWLKPGSSCSCWCFMINPNYRAAGQRRAVGAIAGQGWSSELVTKKD